MFSIRLHVVVMVFPNANVIYAVNRHYVGWTLIKRCRSVVAWVKIRDRERERERERGLIVTHYPYTSSVKRYKTRYSCRGKMPALVLTGKCPSNTHQKAHIP